jgi:hypothetical protein
VGIELVGTQLHGGSAGAGLPGRGRSPVGR